MAELADAQDLGSCAVKCVGSSPTARSVNLLDFQGGYFYIKIISYNKRLTTIIFIIYNLIILLTTNLH